MATEIISKRGYFLPPFKFTMWIFIGIVIMLMGGLVRHFVLDQQFFQDYPDGGSWTPIMYMALFLALIWELVMLLIHQIAHKTLEKQVWRWLIWIFVVLLGILPGLLMIYPAWVKT
ncbi:MAG: hypothetical protein HRT74_14155 [Flavobacteriales bacterium]|nr:hypothetical protein [Flavobacteriales bacterium]